MTGDIIKKLRKEKGISQDELSKSIGVAISSIGSYEINARQPSYDVLRKIADYFEVTTDYLLERTSIPNGTIVTPKNNEEAELIKQIKEIGVESVSMIKDAYNSGLSVEDLKKILELAKDLKKK